VHAADDGRTPAAQPRRETLHVAVRGRHGDRRARDLGHRQGAGAGAGDALDDRGAARRRRRVQRRAHDLRPRLHFLERFAEHGQRRGPRHSLLRREVEAQHHVQRRQVELVDPHGPGERMPPHRRDRLRLADGDAGLRPAEQFVAAERDDVRPGGHALAR